ncbi:MAG: tetratricopeptide repeat protein [Bacteroidia bacterium]|nr:tetratricopeptide repeat protein [Bacteroidia bacterium]
MSSQEASEEYIGTEETVVESAPTAGSKFAKYRNIAIVAVGVAVGVVAGYFVFDYLNEQKNQEAKEQAIQAFKNYERDSLEKALKGSSQYPGLEQIVEEYGSTKTGRLAKYMLGTALISQGKNDEGLRHLEDFGDNGTMVSAVGYAARAYVYEEKKEPLKAAQLWEKAASIKPNAFTTPDYLQQAARCYIDAGDTAAALEIFKQIKKRYPNSEPGRNADKYIAFLSD